MKFRLHFFLLFLLVVFLSTESVNSQENAALKKTISFSTPFLESMTVFSQMKLIYTEAFKRIGSGFKLFRNPGERSLIEVGIGNYEGEAARIANLNKNNKYPNLIRVNEPIMTLYDGAYAIDTSIEVNGWVSLQGTKYEIGILLGTNADFCIF